MFRRTLAAFVLAALTSPAAAQSCLAPGHVVILKASDLDPDVFVWDSRDRVVAYAAGYWRDTKDVLAHSLLAKPGTRASVVKCYSAAVASRYANAREDLLAVRLLSGPGAGRSGWVTSEDVYHATVSSARGAR